jgi:hypothetical protein
MDTGRIRKKTINEEEWVDVVKLANILSIPLDDAVAKKTVVCKIRR